jgi:integrase
MASISNDGNGRRRVQFVHPDGRRMAIRLGKVSHRNAEAFARRMEQLLACMRLNQPMDADLASWVAAQDDRTAGKLSKSGLIPARGQRQATGLGVFIRRYIDGRKDVKPASKEIWRQGEKGLRDYFGAETDIAVITEGMAEDYRQHLIQAELATATIKKRLDFGRQVFRSAVKHQLIPVNPFGDVRIKVHLPDRRWFISLEDTQKLLDACPNEDWRIIVALSRLAGLRCPTEVLSLRWSDIDWDPTEGLMNVPSPKTAHHPGKASRFVPVFGLLRPHLQRAFEAAPEGTTYVVGGTHRESAMGPDGWRNVNLRTQFLRIIQRAGLKPWPRLFHNLRSSRETELMADPRYSPSDVCQWMGHSMRVAERHYLQMRKEAVRAAVAEGSPEAAQNPAQQLRVRSGAARNWGTVEGPDSPRSTMSRDSSRDAAKPTNGEGGIHTSDL